MSSSAHPATYTSYVLQHMTQQKCFSAIKAEIVRHAQFVETSTIFKRGKRIRAVSVSCDFSGAPFVAEVQVDKQRSYELHKASFDEYCDMLLDVWVNTYVSLNVHDAIDSDTENIDFTNKTLVFGLYKTPLRMLAVRNILSHDAKGTNWCNQVRQVVNVFAFGKEFDDAFDNRSAAKEAFQMFKVNFLSSLSFDCARNFDLHSAKFFLRSVNSKDVVHQSAACEMLEVFNARYVHKIMLSQQLQKLFKSYIDSECSCEVAGVTCSVLFEDRDIALYKALEEHFGSQHEQHTKRLTVHYNLFGKRADAVIEFHGQHNSAPVCVASVLRLLSTDMFAHINQSTEVQRFDNMRVKVMWAA